MPVVSKVPWVVLNPFSSASTPKMSCPPSFGVAVEIPSGWVAVPEVVELELEPELQAASRPPEVPMTAMPAPVAAPRARNERRSIRSDIFPLRTATDEVRRRSLAWNTAAGASPPAARSAADGVTLAFRPSPRGFGRRCRRNRCGPAPAVPSGSAGGDQELSQIWVGQTAPVTNPYARCPEGVVGLSKFCTLGWAPHDHTVRPVQM